ncbi:apolipoprotein N-acyltransferase [Prauserella sp. PE36]|uniref:Apolipoprotein N-acyltransferase n=1 Tax=Prauserella endophytica TaxID=1592324 RepID=A0ABY2SA31_9PSEU|nr:MULTISPECIES: apolipoprotein N-acyltransferase [Prauserella]RBM19551.1 apolipoprotein N-acyltransferase [Prauserella sp. PE36]TKG72356.1 apolipoprotein N-acyltransferase [Prauserella endophytica]
MTAAAEAPLSTERHEPVPRSRRLLPVLARLALTVASGLILFASFAPRPLWWLAPLAFTGFGLVLHGRRMWGSAGYGTVFGLAFFLPHLLWIQDFLGDDFGSAPWLGLSTVLAVYIGLACALMPFAARLPGAPVWLAMVFLLQEFARSRWPANGFPWGRVGFSQPEGAYLSLASIGGVPLVGFAVVVTGFGLAWLIMGIREHGARPGRLLVPGLAAILPVTVGLAVWPTVGTGPEAGTRTVAIVQGNAPDIGLDLLGRRDVIRANHLAESERLAERIRTGELPRPDLVVWPETATEVDGPDPALDAMVDEFGVPALIGGAYRAPDGRTENAVIAWRPGEGEGERYVKQELVPFAEYIPLRPIASWFTPFLDDTVDMRWGTEPGALDVAGTRAGPVICYEVAYDYVSREATTAGAQLLVVPTNNAWYGPGEMSYQQLAMSRVRAVEHGRAAVVAATSGVSAIVQPDGSVTQQTGLFTAGSLVADVPLRQQTTLSDRLGASTEYVLVGAALIAVVAGFVLRSRTRRASADHTR